MALKRLAAIMCPLQFSNNWQATYDRTVDNLKPASLRPYINLKRQINLQTPICNYHGLGTTVCLDHIT